MRILILCPTESKVFASIAQSCYESLSSLGYQVERASEYREGYDLALFISFHHKWQIPSTTSTLKVGYHMEQLPWGRNLRALRVWFDKFRKQQEIYDYVVDTSYNNVIWLRKSYSNVYWCALGYHPSFEVPINKASVVPIRFFGALECSRHRRLKIIRYINSELIGNKVCTQPVEFSRGTYGAHIHLNLHNCPQNSWEAYRTIILMCNRQFVLTEKIDDHHPFENGKHWIEANRKDMPFKIKYFLERPEERDKITDAAYGFIKERYNFTTHLQRLIHEIGKFSLPKGCKG